MKSLAELLKLVRNDKRMASNFLGLLNVLIGRRISTADGVLVSAGLSWRQTAALLKRTRWDKAAVRQLGLDPARLPPRDRERYWYHAISLARVDSPKARQAGNELAIDLKRAGYQIGPNPCD